MSDVKEIKVNENEVKEKPVKAKKVKTSVSDKAFNTILTIIATIVLLIVLYPMIYVVSSSFSSGNAVSSGRVYLWPVEFSTIGYEWALNNEMVWTGYANSIFYTLSATVIHLFMTICGAYPLSRKNYQAKGFIQKYLTASMLLGGGLIPLFLVVSSLGLYNNRIWIIISGVVAISHIIIMRTFFQSNIPYELFESARMDGISDYGYLIKIVLPLSKAVIAVISLYAVVGKWNSYLTPLLYLRDRTKYPLQLVLNEMLNQAKFNNVEGGDGSLAGKLAEAMDAIRYALIVVGVAPMLILYPFVQKFFEKGVTIGSVKG